MKRYYDLYKENLCGVLDWRKGSGTLEDAKKHYKTDDIREVSLKEFNRLRNKYCGKECEEQEEEDEFIQIAMF